MLERLDVEGPNFQRVKYLQDHGIIVLTEGTFAMSSLAITHTFWAQGFARDVALYSPLNWLLCSNSVTVSKELYVKQ